MTRTRTLSIGTLAFVTVLLTPMGKAGSGSGRAATPVTAERNATAAPEGEKTPVCQPADPAEWTVLKALRERRKTLDARERVLDEREAVLGGIEKKLQQGANGLFARIDSIETQLKLGEEARRRFEQQVAGLVTTILSLKPKPAALILEATDVETAVMLMVKLGPEKSAPILEKMSPDRAAALVKSMATQTPGRAR